MSLALLVGVSGSVFAQKKGFDYKFYGGNPNIFVSYECSG